ncbi:MAG: HEPN domain-containing protein [Muribaculaceae bacterium]|nr:HEPN domain-containing protein [Muribaculaceae bacterium]
MTLDLKSRSDIVAYRLERAKSTIREVKDVGNIGYWNLAANRLYYAAYYASAALLIHNEIEATSHRGVIRMISASFVRNGIISAEYSKLLGRLFTMRQSGDYEDLFDWDEADVIPLISRVEEYISYIDNLINK